MPATLTAKEFDKIKNDMDKRVEMLTDAEVLAIASKLNRVVNVPLLKEASELVVFSKIVRRIDRALYKALPNEYYELVRNVSDGISPAEAQVLEERLTPAINKVVDIPFLTERMEAKLIGFVVGIIVNAMVKGFRLEEAPA
jgi:hypothetical protein